jgi:dTMP kinase
MRKAAGGSIVRRGLFITFEGTEGTGKSTQAALLEEELRSRGETVVLTREPGGTPLGRELRAILLGLSHADLSAKAELFLYMADRAQHMEKVIAPSLSGGAIVICDRFTDATAAYQGFGRGLEPSTIETLNHAATSGRLPDLTFLLDLQDVSAGLERAMERNADEGTSGVEDRFEREALDFHRRVRDGYRAIAEANPERFTVLSAALSVEELRRRILGRVLEILQDGGAKGQAGVN